MKKLKSVFCLAVALMLVVGLVGCDDDDGSAADRLYVGGVCQSDDECNDEEDDTPELDCLDEFKGGYCGLADCEASDECPEGSLCADLDGDTYCFLVCVEKIDCNLNRPIEDELSNCSSNIDPVEGGTEKLCIPPSAS